MTEKLVREHFRDFIDDLPLKTGKQVLMSPLCLVFYLLEALYIYCYFKFDHEVPDEQIANALKTCNVVVHKNEPLWMTLGTNCYSISLVGGLYGLWLTRFDTHKVASFKNLEDFWLL